MKTHRLQDDLEKILKWAELNNMALNNEKFEVIHYGINEETKKERAKKKS